MAFFAQKYLCVWWTNSQVAEPAMHCAKTVGLLEHQLLTMHCTGTSHVHSIFAQQLAEIFNLVSIRSRSCHVRSCRLKKNMGAFQCVSNLFQAFPAIAQLANEGQKMQKLLNSSPNVAVKSCLKNVEKLPGNEVTGLATYTGSLA